jgi:hypothetical protein
LILEARCSAASENWFAGCATVSLGTCAWEPGGPEDSFFSRMDERTVSYYQHQYQYQYQKPFQLHSQRLEFLKNTVHPSSLIQKSPRDVCADVMRLCPLQSKGFSFQMKPQRPVITITRSEASYGHAYALCEGFADRDAYEVICTTCMYSTLEYVEYLLLPHEQCADVQDRRGNSPCKSVHPR